MENEFENKIKIAMDKFVGKSVKVTITGIIGSEFCMKKINYEIEEGILVIEDGDTAYLDVDIDDIENLYSEFTSGGYALLAFKVGRDLQIEIQTKDDNVIPLKEKIWKRLVEAGLAEEFYKEVCGAWISTTLSSKLSWSHYVELIRIEEDKKRQFYLKECIDCRWSVRELRRQTGSLLYERLALSKDKQKVLELAKNGQVLEQGKDLVKDPFVLEFLDIKENTEYLETDLEKNILKHLKEFLLELGKGFSFVGNQVRITLEEDHFYPDLVFYNRLLKCFVIIDLKIGEITHQDIGQMQMYVNYYDRDIKSEDENQTVGILLSTKKKETIVKYTLPEDNKSIFVSQYKLHLPTEEKLIEVVEEEKKNFELNQK